MTNIITDMNSLTLLFINILIGTCFFALCGLVAVSVCYIPKIWSYIVNLNFIKDGERS